MELPFISIFIIHTITRFLHTPLDLSSGNEGVLSRYATRDYVDGMSIILTRTRVLNIRIFVQYRKTDTALIIQTETSIHGGFVIGEAQGTS